MSNYSPAWPHGEIEKIFENIYSVRGTTVTYFEKMKIQHSRNMTIIRDNNHLVLINTVRLNKQGLEQLDKLGNVKHIINIGAFHGRDDAYYLDRYDADYWTCQPNKKFIHKQGYHSINDQSTLPLKESQFFLFKNSNPKEGFIYLKRNVGILITCDSIKNWIKTDEFFSKGSAIMALKNGEIKKAHISPIWLNATGVKKSDFTPLLKLKFKHMISAHGDLLKNTAYEDIKNSIEILE